MNTSARKVSPKKKSIGNPAVFYEKIAVGIEEEPVLFCGGLDEVYGNRLMGWAYALADKNGQMEVEIGVDDQPVLTTRTGLPRVDLPNDTGHPLHCGFEVNLPEHLLDGRAHRFVLRAAPQGSLIADAHLVVNVAVRAAPLADVRPVEGHVDHLQGVFITGWAFDPEAPEKPVLVQAMNGTQCLATAMANLFRADLLSAGKGSGCCAFALRLPPTAFDGPEFEIQIRDAKTGMVLPGFKPTIPAIAVHGHIEGLHGAAAVGWVRLEGQDGPVAVDLWVDGEFASSAVAERVIAESGGKHFNLGIPDRFLDGRPHELIVALAHHPGRYVAIDVRMLPMALTPMDALQRYAGTRYLRSYLSPLGPQRYESVRQGLAMLADQARAATTPDQLARIVHAVIALSNGQEQVIKGFDAPVQVYKPIEFAPHSKPDVSVVIPVHNKFATTYNCLASIAAAQCRASFEVIIVDDGSQDETLHLNNIVQGLKLVRHEVAQGFVGACNAGAARAVGQYIVMLNNDTEVMSGWLDALLEPFENFDSVGMTGAKLIYPDGKLQEAGGLIWGDGEPWNVGRHANAADPRYNYVRQVDYISGACIMLPMSLWHELKGFDTYFAPAYYEDTDLAFRVRSRGFKTVYTPFCEVVHYEGVSNGTSTSGGGLKRFQAINQPKFKQRWAREYRYNGVIGRDAPHVMQDRGTRFRVLVLDAQTLTPDLDAGSYSATQEIRLLQSLGCKVTFVPANMAYMGDYTEALQRMGVEVLYAPFYYSMNEVIERRGDEFDLIYVARYGVAEQVIDTIRARLPQIKVILNIHDLHFLRELREAAQNRDPELMQQALQTRDAELAVLRKVDLALSYSEVEQAIVFSHNLDATRTAACPWVVETADNVPTFDEREGLAFLGGFGHRPNAEAVEWFVREVMPLLRKKLPGVPLRIYGSKAPDTLRKLVAEDVILEGFVKTTDQVYDRARVFIAPLLTGAGLKGKVVGAFARGIPTVMTPTAAEGTGAAHGLSAMICESAADWARYILEIYLNRQVWSTMSQAGLELARQRYSFEAGRVRMTSALNQVGVFPDGSSSALWFKRAST